MAKIALGGAVIIPLGLAASTISSALGSIMVAPRTLQALAADRSFPSSRLNNWLFKSREKNHEPINASLVTSAIAILFVLMGSVNAVAEIISMFFMVTYGSLCLISFLNHFGSSPAYRPYFKSRWYISLVGFVVSVWVMFKINSSYALAAIILMTLVYLYVNHYHKHRKGLEAIFANTIFQLNRNLQVYIQKSVSKKMGGEWRPSAICISEDSFQRNTAFNLLNWISYKYGFGTYIHLITGYFSKSTYQQSQEQLKKLIESFDRMENHVYVDTLISPSYTSAVAQTIQVPGIAGMENNMVIFEFDKQQPEKASSIAENFKLVTSGNFDVCILGTSQKQIEHRNGIHVWIRSIDSENANLMIMLSFIILGHPDWHKANISIFETCKLENLAETQKRMEELVATGRLPLTSKNIEIITENEGINIKTLISQRSSDAGLVILGIREEQIRHSGQVVFEGYEDLGAVLFVNSHNQKEIE